MSEKLPYEDAFERQMDHLPLPDEDASWQKMKRLLDEKERRRPLAFFSTFAGGSMLFVLSLLGIWTTMHSLHRVTGKPVPAVHSGDPAILHRKTIPRTASKHAPVASSVQRRMKDPASRQEDAYGRPDSHPDLTSITQKSFKPERPDAGIRKEAHHPQTRSWSTANRQSTGSGSRQSRAKKPGLRYPGRAGKPEQDDATGFPAASAVMQNKQALGDTAVHGTTGMKDSASVAGDTMRHAGTAMIKEPAAGISSSAVKKYSINAGVCIQQQIPPGGLQPVLYGINGDTSLLSNYIPSLYVRFEKDRRWYLQAAFSYAVPQLVSDFSYYRYVDANSTAGFITTTSRNVKKIFYSRVPLSFDYYVRPNWTVGAGGAYSWFRSAVTVEETVTRDVQTRTNVVMKQVLFVKRGSDTSMFRSHASLLLQTDYHWRRFTVGLRILQDVQPYMRYTQPDGTGASRKNSSIEATVHFRLW